MSDVAYETRIDRFSKIMEKHRSVLGDQISKNIEENNNSFGPEFRSFKDWAVAFNSAANDDHTDKRAMGVFKDFMADKYENLTADEVLEDKANSGAEKPLKELRKEFSEWLVLNEPWNISEMRVVAGSILFNKDNWVEGGTLSKNLNEAMGVSTYAEMQENVESGKYDQNTVIKQYLLALTNNNQSETLKSIYLVARESYPQNDTRKLTEKSEGDWMRFNLKPNTSALERLTKDAGREGEELEDTFKNFAIRLVSAELSEINFKVYQDKINVIELKMKNGELTSLPLALFVKLFDGVEYLKSENGEPIGLTFRNNEDTLDIRPETPPNVVKKDLMSVGISGSPITNEINVNMVRFTKLNKA